MPTAFVACAVAALLAGPPALPPLPGERPARAPDADPPKQPSPKPVGPGAPKPVRPKQPAPPPASDPATTRDPAPPPAVEAPAAPEGSAASEPTAAPGPVEIPQPEVPPPQAAPSEPAAADRSRSDSPSAPAKPAARPEGPRDGRWTPDADAPGEAAPVAKPSPRPPHSGAGLFAASGLLFALGLAQQLAGHILLKRRCFDPLGPDALTLEQLGDAALGCSSGFVPALVLHAHAALAFTGSIGLAAGGAALRAERGAWDEDTGARQPRAAARLTGTGAGLAAGGVALWLAGTAVSWALVFRCGDADCVAGTRVAGFATRDVGLALLGSGLALAVYGARLRRLRGRTPQSARVGVAPSFLRSGAGFAVHGRF